MNKHISSYLIFTLLFASTAFSQTLENFSFEQKGPKDSCMLELSANDGSVTSINFKLNLSHDKNLTDEEIALGTSKIWPDDLTWDSSLDGSNLIWITEKLKKKETRKVIQEAFKLEDKLKAFLSSTADNFRLILDLQVRVVPSKTDNTIDLYFVATRNSKKTLDDLFKEKFSDNFEAMKTDTNSCFKMEYTPKGSNDITAEVWGVKTLKLKAEELEQAQ